MAPVQISLKCIFRQENCRVKIEKEAITVYSRILELDGNQLKSLKNRAKLYGEIREFSKAVNDYDRAIEIDPNDTELYHERANSLFQIRGRENESIADYNKSIAIDPRNIRAYNNRGRTLCISIDVMRPTKILIM